MRRLTTKKAFVNWLRRQSNRITFRRATCDDCPLAKFTGLKVFQGTYGTGLSDVLRMPKWAYRYITKFDGPNPAVGKPANKQDALAAL